MAIEILDRPAKTLSNGFLSKWSSSELPLQYKLSSNLFPVNTFDTPKGILTLAYSTSLIGTRIELSTELRINAGQMVTVNGTGTELDGNSYYVKGYVTDFIVILDVKTDDTATTGGTLIKFYNNYKGLVKVFSGAPNQHPYNIDGSKPMEEIGIIEVDFKNVNGVNLGFANVNGYVKAAMNAKFDTDENTHFGWSGFYVEYTDSYDLSPSSSRINIYQEDLTTTCVPFTDFFDPSFNNGLTDWNETSSSSSSWVGGVGSISFSGKESNVISQSKTLLEGVQYFLDISYDVTAINLPLGNFVVFLLRPGLNGSFPTSLSSITQVNQTGTGTYRFTFTPSREYDNIGFSIDCNASTGADVTINSVNINTNVEQPCLFVQFANFGAKQFQDNLGGNFGDYVLNPVDSLTPKMLTRFNEKTYFKGKPFYFSAIIPASTFSLSENNDNVFLDIELFNGSNKVESFKYKVQNEGEGVYTVDISESIPDIDWNTGKAQFTIVPANSFLDCTEGTFENTNPQQWGITDFPYSPSNPNYISNGFGLSTSYKRTGLSSGKFGFAASNMIQSLKTYELFKNNNGVEVKQGLFYEFTAFFLMPTGTFDPLQLNNGSFYFLPNGYTKEECEITPFNIIESNLYQSGTTPSINDWKELKTTFTAKADGFLTFTCKEDIETDIATSTGGEIFIDDITFKGPIDFISEVKPIKKGCDCSLYGGTLRWMTDLNGWDSWHFNKKKIEKEKVSKKIDVINDYGTNWDIDFIDGETEKDTIKTTASKSVILRSQLLTVNERTVLEQIKRSARVQYLTDSGKWQTVTIRASSFTVIDQEQKVQDMEIEINLPQLVIQGQ